MQSLDEQLNSAATANRSGKVLAFVSGKGGPGKTVLATSLAYVLNKVGKKVLLIDTDFITRGSSYFLIADAAESAVLDIDQESAVSQVLRNPPLIESCLPAIVRRPEGDEYHVFFADADLFKGGQLDAEYNRTLDPFQFYQGLKRLCDRLRSAYDYVLLDTHGGYDESSAIPALVADGFVVVLEVDKLSINQTRAFLTSIESYGPRFEVPGSSPRKRLQGFISNKWIYSVKDKTILNHLQDLFGGVPFGNIPWDKTVALDYGNKYMTLARHPGSDFAYCTVQAFSKLLGPKLNWAPEPEQKFRELEAHHARIWRISRANRVAQAALFIAGAVALALSAGSYLLYQRGHLLSTLKVPLILLVVFMACAGILWAEKLSEALSAKPGDDARALARQRLLKWPATGAVAAVFAFVLYLFASVLPARLSSQALLQRIAADQQIISDQTTKIARLNSDYVDEQNKLQLTTFDLHETQKISSDLNLQVSTLQSQVTKQNGQIGTLNSQVADLQSKLAASQNFEEPQTASVEGTWQGTLTTPEGRLPIMFRLSAEGSGTADDVVHKLQGIPLRYSNKGSQVNISIPLLKAYYDATLRGNELGGNFVQNGASFPLVVTKWAGK